jgi:hypothetical protein
VLAAALSLNVAALWPDLAASRVDLNDNVLHFTLVERMVQAVGRGENPLDCWSPEWSLGYPVARTYQPLAHATVALTYFALGKTVPLMTVFVWIRFLSVALLPATFFAAARLMELPPVTAAAAAALAPLVSTNFLYGVEYGSYVWAGSGLFPQAVACHLFLLTMGLAYGAIRRNRLMVLTGVVLGLTFLAHFIYGYMGALSVCVLALIPDAEARRSVRLRRALRAGAVALLVTGFEVAALVSDGSTINHSRWEPAWKWDSFGAGQVLRWLATGELLDHGRVPVLSLLALLGAGALLWDLRKRRRIPAARKFILLGAALWVLVFFGRPTWGLLLALAGVLPDMQLHRVIGGVHVFLILLAAMGTEALLRAIAGRWNRAAAAAACVLVLYPMVWERSRFLRNDAVWGRANLAAYASEQKALEATVAEARTRGGRVYAGLAAGWGGSFKIGDVPFYAFLSKGNVPAVAFLYHAMALTSDIMVRFNEWNPAHYRLFNVRTVVAPASQATLPPFLVPHRENGRFRVFDAPGGGYFDVVEAPFSVRTTKDDFYGVNDRWLESDWVGRRLHLQLDMGGGVPPEVPHLLASGPLPDIPPAPPAGEVRSEQRDGERYRARLQVWRPAFALFKMTWHSSWKALVDGRAEKVVMLSPGFVGVPIAPGEHEVVLRYEPGVWRMVLGAAGFGVAILLVLGESRARRQRGWRKGRLVL